jgi:hypothetical protein
VKTANFTNAVDAIRLYMELFPKAGSSRFAYIYSDRSTPTWNFRYSTQDLEHSRSDRILERPRSDRVLDIESETIQSIEQEANLNIRRLALRVGVSTLIIIYRTLHE